ncbi:replication initiator protein A [Mesobacillus subterraneus]|uniref:replication initiator protein A n=1 Tax=Mesobacillus subterraneus TaxID=285983 RepID=UPI001CFD6FD2|nr:replication initiator protein A [Mesobacillus subterraneus]WLR53781.1 replication initiator protein A [Mesobacillus subterraneus]
MKKNYITKEYIEMLRDRNKETGLYYATPKVICKGDKYRKALKPVEKLLYQEMYDLAMKAAYKGQVDTKGNVYVKVSYSFLAVAVGVDPSTIDRAIGEDKNLFRTGLLAFKKKGTKSEHEYYVMAPKYIGEDKSLLSIDQVTWEMLQDVRKFARRKNPNRTFNLEVENKILEDERKADTALNKAEYDLNRPEYPDMNEPSMVEPKPKPKPSSEYIDLMKRIKKLGIIYHKHKQETKLIPIAEKHFGVGGKITLATEADLQKMILTYKDMVSTAISLGIVKKKK